MLKLMENRIYRVSLQLLHLFLLWYSCLPHGAEIPDLRWHTNVQLGGMSSNSILWHVWRMHSNKLDPLNVKCNINNLPKPCYARSCTPVLNLKLLMKRGIVSWGTMIINCLTKDENDGEGFTDILDAERQRGVWHDRLNSEGKLSNGIRNWKKGRNRHCRGIMNHVCYEKKVAYSAS